MPLFYLNGDISVKFHLTKVYWATFHQWRICFFYVYARPRCKSESKRNV